MEYVEDIAKRSRRFTATPAVASLRKVAGHLTPLYRTWIERSRFCVLTTVGPDGTDGSPRGDDGPVAMALDPKTLVQCRIGVATIGWIRCAISCWTAGCHALMREGGFDPDGIR